MSTNDFNVSFRYVGIPTSLGTVCGVCLSYQRKEGAESFFTYIYTYLSAPGRIPKTILSVAATKDLNEKYLFEVHVGWGETIRRVEIEGVEPTHINELSKSLKVFKYYLLLAGYEAEDGSFVLLPVANHHLFVNTITIDDKQYSGNPGCKLSWDKLIQSDYIISVE